MVYGWLWILLILFSAAVTLLSRKNIYAAFSVGSVVAIIIDLFKIDLIWQIAAFGIAAVIYIVVYEHFYGNNGNEGIADTSELVGKKCIVDEEINNAAGSGQVTVNGISWSARSVNDDITYSVGEILTVVAVEGVKLICRN